MPPMINPALSRLSTCSVKAQGRYLECWPRFKMPNWHLKDTPPASGQRNAGRWLAGGQKPWPPIPSWPSACRCSMTLSAATDVRLEPANKAYATIRPRRKLVVEGVVGSVIRKLL